MKKLSILSVLAVAALTSGCASPGVSGERVAENYVRKVADKEVTCFKPAPMPSRGQIFGMLRREGIDPEVRRQGEIVKRSMEQTYNQEAMLYRVCLDYAGGIIDDRAYYEQVELVLSGG